jgi:hypothetical protein
MRAAPALLAAILIAAAGCAPGASPSMPPAVTPTDPGDGAASAPAAVATATGGPFGRHDTPPGGVASFLEFPGGGAGTCFYEGTGAPSVRLDVGPFPTAVCTFDFTPGQTVDLLLVGPDGSEWARTERADDAGIAIWELDDLPDPFEGEYTVRATQADVTVQSTTSTFEWGSLAGMFIPEEIRIGETGRLFVAGGQTGQRIPTYLYFAPEDSYLGPDGTLGYRFAADVGQVELNANREGRMAFTPQSGDPTGHYLVVVDGGPAASSTEEPPVVYLMFEVRP